MGILDYVYGEHFIEHLELDGAVKFLQNARSGLRVGGAIRLSTPSLEWVLATHFDSKQKDEQKMLSQTFKLNRAFHGWGHKFLYSKIFLEHLLQAVGYKSIKVFSYGVSDDPNLINMERHGGFSMQGDFPSVWIVEAKKESDELVTNNEFISKIEHEYVRFVKSGH